MTTADSFERDLLWAWTESAQVGLCVLDSGGSIIIVNNALTTQFMVRAPALIGFDLTALFGALRVDADVLSFLRSASSGQMREFAGQLGAVTVHLSASVTSVPYSKGDVYRVIAFSDISTLRKTQADLDQVARQYDAMYAGVVISDARAPDMPIVFVNAMFERMTGYTRAEVIGRNCRFLQRDDSDQPDLTAIRTAIRDKTNGYALLRNYRKDGRQILTELFISPVRDQTGEVTHFIGVQHLRARAS